MKIPPTPAKRPISRLLNIGWVFKDPRVEPVMCVLVGLKGGPAKKVKIYLLKKISRDFSFSIELAQYAMEETGWMLLAVPSPLHPFCLG